jgi:hypothetical protein
MVVRAQRRMAPAHLRKLTEWAEYWSKNLPGYDSPKDVGWRSAAREVLRILHRGALTDMTYLNCPECGEDVEVLNVWRPPDVIECANCKARLKLETDTIEGEHGKEEEHQLVRVSG